MVELTQKSNNLWLVLMHQIPAKPEALRVRVWRRLQKLGAIQLKNSVYLLPDTEFYRSHVEEITNEIRDGEGEVFLFGASWFKGIDERELLSRHEQNLSRETGPLVKEARRWMSLLSRKRNADVLMDALHIYGKLVSRSRELQKRDHFGSQAMIELDSVTKNLAMRLFGSAEEKSEGKHAVAKEGRWVWVTRKRPGVDRLSSAWLIRRFIDPLADIQFVDMDQYQHKPDHLRFDVFAGEFTHEEDLCTFEVLLSRFGLESPVLRLLGDIIHDLDIGDEKYRRCETNEVRELLAVSRQSDDDQERLSEACKRFDAWLALRVL